MLTNNIHPTELDQPYVLTWSSSSLLRLILPDSEVHLWSDSIIRYADRSERKFPWRFESVLEITEQEAKQVLEEWMFNGPFGRLEVEIRRFPETLSTRLVAQVQ